MNKSIKIILAPALAMLVLAALGFSETPTDKVYKWTERSGKTYYSTTAKNPDDKPSELPKIGREDLDKKIEKIKSETPPNCDSHGGVDCSLGPDTDGSVICSNGYRDAILPFRFHCLEARLEVEFLLEPEDRPDVPLKHSNKELRQQGLRKIKALQLSIRNLSAVEAFGIQASFKLPSWVEKNRPAEGPDKIEPFGLEYYTASFVEPVPARSLLNSRYRVRCTNCGAVINRP